MKKLALVLLFSLTLVGQALMPKTEHKRTEPNRIQALDSQRREMEFRAQKERKVQHFQGHYRLRPVARQQFVGCNHFRRPTGRHYFKHRFHAQHRSMPCGRGI